jgi:hypothetical protein
MRTNRNPPKAEGSPQLLKNPEAETLKIESSREQMLYTLTLKLKVRKTNQQLCDMTRYQ